MGKINWQLLVTREVCLLERYWRVKGYTRRFFPLTRVKAKNFLTLSEKNVICVYDDPVASLWRRRIIRRDFSQRNAVNKFNLYFETVLEDLKAFQQKLVKTNDFSFYRRFIDYYQTSRAIVFYTREVVNVALEKKDRRFARWAGRWHHRSEELSCQAWDNLKSFFLFVGRQKGVYWSRLQYYTPEEFNKLLADGQKVRIKVIKTRQRKYGLILLNNKINLLTGRALDAFIAKNLPKVKIEAKHKITGRAAYSGIIRGRVRRVFTGTQAAKMKKGEILVTPMTSPRMIQAVKLAGAFVTDEGGLTCHAAIVARELRIPCVIGTKIATQVLKNGDLVEVDANRGIVRRLKY
ncbi:MAG: PEP-utilizing enzyme [Patescibacteria group bacterium]